MDLKTALGQLPNHQRASFEAEVHFRWLNEIEEEEAVYLTWAWLRRPGVLWRQPWGLGHWCRGWDYCLRCYGD